MAPIKRPRFGLVALSRDPSFKSGWPEIAGRDRPRPRSSSVFVAVAKVFGRHIYGLPSLHLIVALKLANPRLVSSNPRKALKLCLYPFGSVLQSCNTFRLANGFVASAVFLEFVHQADGRYARWPLSSRSGTPGCPAQARRWAQRHARPEVRFGPEIDQHRPVGVETTCLKQDRSADIQSVVACPSGKRMSG